MTTSRAFLRISRVALLLLCSCIEANPDETSSIGQHELIADLGSALGSPVAIGNTSTLTNERVPLCEPNSTAPEATFLWTPPAAGAYVISTEGSSFDTVLDVREAFTGNPVRCNDDVQRGILYSRVGVSVPVGKVLAISVDGFASATGNYELHITQVPLAGLQLWLRDDAGVETNDWGAILQWRDQSGNGRDALTDELHAPDVAGAGIRFHGAGGFHLTSPFQSPTFSVFVVGKNNQTDNNAFSMILGPSGDFRNNQLRWQDQSNAMLVGTAFNSSITTAPIGNTLSEHALSVRYDGSTATIYRNGQAITSAPLFSREPWGFNAIGTYHDQFNMVGELSEVLALDHAVTEDERASINRYLQSKYDLF